MGSVLEIGAVLLALILHSGLVVVSSAWVVVMMVEGAVLWPTVAVAGELPGSLPERLRGTVRWMAPRTFANDVPGPRVEPS